PGGVGGWVDPGHSGLGRASLRAYLEHGFMVAITGSKFLAGPTFSGALLVPRTLARKLRRQPLPPAFGAYSTRAEWPRGWTASRSLPDTANYGLLLRWEAALEELRAFGGIPEHEIAAFLLRVAGTVQARLAAG